MSLDAEAFLPAVADDVLAQAPQQLDLKPPQSDQEEQESETLVRAPAVRSPVFDEGGAPQDVSTLAPEVAAEKRIDLGLSASRFGAVPLHHLLMAGALMAAVGVGWIGGWNSYDFLAAAPASPPSKHVLKVRPCSSGESTCVARRSDRESIPASGGRKVVATPNSEVVGVDEIVAPCQQGSRCVGETGLAADRSAPALIEAALARHDRLKGRSVQVPVPETRPATIEGWRVRQVVGDKAVLEGPNGMVTASRGDDVSGVGRVDSIVHWGKYWIVATSMGLISTQN
jgi:hypothetical protein